MADAGTVADLEQQEWAIKGCMVDNIQRCRPLKPISHPAWLRRMVPSQSKEPSSRRQGILLLGRGRAWRAPSCLGVLDVPDAFYQSSVSSTSEQLQSRHLFTFVGGGASLASSACLKYMKRSTLSMCSSSCDRQRVRSAGALERQRRRDRWRNKEQKRSRRKIQQTGRLFC